jgi:DNA-binding transcriptional ArsR family regulator
MEALDVIDDPAAAIAALGPVRSRLLAALHEPGSAAMLAPAVGLTRQKVNYYLRALEREGLVRVVEERRWGGITERVFQASAASYVVSPEALGTVAGDPARVPDRLSARYLIALGARIVREVAGLLKRAEHEDKRLATLGLDAEIRFSSAAERAAFADDLARAISELVARYHDTSAPGGRPHRLVVAAHPLPHAPEDEKARHERAR